MDIMNLVSHGFCTRLTMQRQ